MLRARLNALVRFGMVTEPRGVLTWACIVATWLLLALSGIVVLARSKAVAGAEASAPGRWPTASRIVRDAARPCLILIAHPRCPCTRASLSELSRLLARLPEKPAVHVLFVRPEGVAADWHDTDLWRRAGTIPGAALELDEGGSEAALFGARTSGETLLYDRDGRLMFHGGITAARGHEGDNVGASRIVALLTSGSTDQHDGAVFGCALLNDKSADER
jgi:hypothetical protein